MFEEEYFSTQNTFKVENVMSLDVHPAEKLQGFKHAEGIHVFWFWKLPRGPQVTSILKILVGATLPLEESLTRNICTYMM